MLNLWETKMTQKFQFVRPKAGPLPQLLVCIIVYFFQQDGRKVEKYS